MHKIEITSIQKNSIAEELGIEPGDFLLSVNEQIIHDVFDYKFYCADTNITLEIEKKNGESWQFDIEKDEAEDLGIEFATSLLDEEKSCRNKCIFCFIDQLPEGMRDTLYFKDDDARLSFLYGNYITMTNLSDDEINRIIRYRMSPVNISVHTTNPELRVKMLRNRFAGDILEKIRRFTSNGITVNCQIVLCPGINDGEELDRTIRELTSLAPELHSISVVPVGLTRFREDLTQLTPFNKKSALKIIDQVEKWQKKLLEEYKSRIVYIADELYILAEKPLPDYEAYEDFPQIENGVGMVSSFSYEVKEALKELEESQLSVEREITVSIATGVSAFGHFKKITSYIEERVKGLKINVYAVENTFFGPGVTVTGLLTSCDLIRELIDKDLGEKLLLCKNMFRAGTNVMLDDVTADELAEKLGVKVQLVDSDGHALIEALVQE
jgi:putative radical SAM enzyme (TIGR03279 family)